MDFATPRPLRQRAGQAEQEERQRLIATPDSLARAVDEERSVGQNYWPLLLLVVAVVLVSGVLIGSQSAQASLPRGFLRPDHVFTKSELASKLGHTPQSAHDESARGRGGHQHIQPVLWMAPFFSGGGLTSEAITLTIGLRKFNHEFPLTIEQSGALPDHRFAAGLPPEMRDYLHSLQRRANPAHRSIVVCHSSPAVWLPTVAPLPCPPRHLRHANSPDSYVVGRTMFDTDSVPFSWVKKFQLSQVREIWVPSEFHKRTFSASGVPLHQLHVIPESVNTWVFDPRVQTGDAELMADDGRFKFLSIFRWEERKGWRFLLEAYLREFKAEDKCVLYILSQLPEVIRHDPKAGTPLSDEQILEMLVETQTATAADLAHDSSDHPESTPANVRFARSTNAWRSETERVVFRIMRRYIQEFAQGQLGLHVNDASLPEVRLLPADMPTTRVPGLYKAADAFVLPTRGEGWGQTIVEAMSMELPVIATRWSGVEAYLTEHNGYPLHYDRLELVENPSPELTGHQWARPSVAHLRELMRHVRTHPEEASKIGKQARADMVSKFCPECVVEAVAARLREITHKELPRLKRTRHGELGHEASERSDGERRRLSKLLSNGARAGLQLAKQLHVLEGAIRAEMKAAEEKGNSTSVVKTDTPE